VLNEENDRCGLPEGHISHHGYGPDATTIGERGEVRGATWESATE
jgi:hypothetical protein